MDQKNSLIVFQGDEVRRTWFNDEWWFSVVDIVSVLTGSVDAKDYWYRLKKRELESSEVELSTICRQLKLRASDGKLRETDCANTESILRIVQSIPSKKAESFKRWLARVGYERVQEIENPELAQDRARKYYELKGYPKDWIDKRLRGIAIRQDLTNEWKTRGVKEGKEYAILTNEISKATFGVPIKQHKQIKGLNPKFQNQNLRDHMADLELIFNMLGEAATTEITRNKDVEGFDRSKQAAKEGGDVAGKARKDLEKKSGRRVVTSANYLDLQKEKKKLGELRPVIEDFHERVIYSDKELVVGVKQSMKEAKSGKGKTLKSEKEMDEYFEEL